MPLQMGREPGLKQTQHTMDGVYEVKKNMQHVLCMRGHTLNNTSFRKLLAMQRPGTGQHNIGRDVAESGYTIVTQRPHGICIGLGRALWNMKGCSIGPFNTTRDSCPLPQLSSQSKASSQSV